MRKRQKIRLNILSKTQYSFVASSMEMVVNVNCDVIYDTSLPRGRQVKDQIGRDGLMKVIVAYSRVHL